MKLLTNINLFLLIILLLALIASASEVSGGEIEAAQILRARENHENNSATTSKYGTGSIGLFLVLLLLLV
jgi:hypothetical protein